VVFVGRKKHFNITDVVFNFNGMGRSIIIKRRPKLFLAQYDAER
jgi:hypothetical protein